MSLDIQLKKKLTELEMEKEEKSTQREEYSALEKELDSLKQQHREALRDLKTFKEKVFSCASTRADYSLCQSYFRGLAVNCSRRSVWMLTAFVRNKLWNNAEAQSKPRSPRLRTWRLLLISSGISIKGSPGGFPC